MRRVVKILAWLLGLLFLLILAGLVAITPAAGFVTQPSGGAPAGPDRCRPGYRPGYPAPLRRHRPPRYCHERPCAGSERHGYTGPHRQPDGQIQPHGPVPGQRRACAAPQTGRRRVQPFHRTGRGEPHRLHHEPVPRIPHPSQGERGVFGVGQSCQRQIRGGEQLHLPLRQH